MTTGSDDGDVIVVGSANVDTTYQVPHLVGPGETVLATGETIRLGGKGANQAVAASRFGAETSLFACLGRDDVGCWIRDQLAEEGVNISSLGISDSPTGRAFVFVDPAGENQILVSPGSNLDLDETVLQPAAVRLASIPVLLMQMEVPAAVVSRAAKLCGGRVLLNPAPMPPTGLPRDLLDSVDILIPNRSELARLTRREIVSIGDAFAAMDQLPHSIDVVLTLGAEGVLLRQQNEFSRIPALQVNAVDTTGAGDTFCGVLAAGLGEEMNLVEAARLANVAAALSTTEAGAVTSPRRDRVNDVDSPPAKPGLKNDEGKEASWM